jgi:hypothetical protein
MDMADFHGSVAGGRTPDILTPMAGHGGMKDNFQENGFRGLDGANPIDTIVHNHAGFGFVLRAGLSGSRRTPKAYGVKLGKLTSAAGTYNS